MKMLVLETQSLGWCDGRSECALCMSTFFKVLCKDSFLVHFCIRRIFFSRARLECRPSSKLVIDVFRTENGEFDEKKLS